MFRPAERKKAKLRLGISGYSGSGKTYSALQIAFGLGGKVAVIDTENSSAELYAHLGAYDVAILTPPFTTQRYIQLIKEAEKNYNTIIIDSLSPAWAGEGGLLDQHDLKVKAQRGGNSFTAWKEITPLYNQLIGAILQSPSHIIATFRAKQDYVLTSTDKGQTPKKVGMAPIQREGIDFEFTLFLEFGQDHIAQAAKDRTGLFDGSPFLPSVETGEKLNQWLNEGIAVIDYNNLISPSQVKLLYTLANNNNIPTEEMKALIQNKWNKNSSKELTKEEANWLIEYLQGEKAGVSNE